MINAVRTTVKGLKALMARAKSHLLRNASKVDNHIRSDESTAGAPVFQPRKMIRAVLVVAAAVWGMVVDGNFIGILAPTGNSTVFQASTAACFALLGILLGPLEGALGGLFRDGSSYLVTLLLHPSVPLHEGFLHWAGRGFFDIVEDVVLGLVPGLVALKTRRVGRLALVSGVTAWLSLPLLVIGNTLVDLRPGAIWMALTTTPGDWDEPVDPRLTVYALVTATMVGVALLVVAKMRRSLAENRP